MRNASIALLSFILASTAWGVGQSTAQVLAAKIKNGSGTLSINSSGTITVPNGTDTLVGKATTDTLTGKTMSGASNTFSNLARASVATGTANHVVINDGSGNLSSEATLAKSRGGWAQDNSSLTLPSSGTVPAYTPTNHGVVISGAAAAANVTTAGTAGQILVSNGASADPTFQDASGVTGIPTQAYELSNVGLSATISSNTLIIALKQSDGSTDCSTGSAACKIGFRGTTATNGNYSQVSFTAASSLTLGTTASLGNASGVGAFAYIYAIQDGTSELCASTALLDEGALQSATATPATTGGTLYCTNVHTTRPVRLIGFVTATWSNPNWSSITALKIWPFNPVITGTFTVTFGTTVFTASQTAVFSYSKRGNVVTGSLAAVTAACSHAAQPNSTTTGLPSYLWAATDVYQQGIAIADSSTNQTSPGMMRVQTDGTISIYKNLAAANYTASGNCGWNFEIPISYRASF
jgi:hypothetical protein